MTFVRAGYPSLYETGSSRQRNSVTRDKIQSEVTVSEMTIPETEPEESEAADLPGASASVVEAGAVEEVNEAVQGGVASDGDPNDDRMGAPVLMPD
ncbi:MAG: hypothetical protein H7Z41_11595 [Cytophagales bacterium]|nr:hypothetical protein [Armatimonadota bacterium]